VIVAKTMTPAKYFVHEEQSSGIVDEETELEEESDVPAPEISEFVDMSKIKLELEDYQPAYDDMQEHHFALDQSDLEQPFFCTVTLKVPPTHQAYSD